MAASLDSPEELDELLQNADAVMNCAGRFADTWKPMAHACLRNGCHYLDITGEIEVFESMHRLESQFRCNGSIEMVGTAYKTRLIDFGERKLNVVSIPWDDVSTSCHSTGIGNITVYMAMPPKQIKLLQLSKYVEPLLRTGAVRNVLTWLAERGKPGPDKKERCAGKSLLWGEVGNDRGENRSARIQQWRATGLMQTAVLIVRKVLEGKFEPGYQTPTMAYGAGLILEIDETGRTIID